jgi:hypothetical protein
VTITALPKLEPEPAVTPVGPVGPVELAREVELLDDAMAALRADRPARALSAILSFERETLGRGQLAEDAAAIELEARCRLGEDVAARLDAFDRRWPESAQRARITSACR